MSVVDGFPSLDYELTVDPPERLARLFTLCFSRDRRQRKRGWRYIETSRKPDGCLPARPRI